MLWTRKAFLAALVAAPAGAAYARLVEPRWLALRRLNITLPGARLPRPLKLLHLADLHASDSVPLSFLREAIALGLAEQPDLIALTGDFISTRFDDWEAYTKVLSVLPEAAPTFACLGNHDGGEWAAARGSYSSPAAVAQCLSTAGIRVLENETVIHDCAGTRLALTGVADLWSGNFHASRAFAGAHGLDAAARLLLAHNPDSKDQLRDQPWDLMLSGHTHGGQVVVPLFGAPFAPVSDYRFIEGLHRWEDRQLFITRGVGTLHSLRFNCRPEVSLLTLHAA